MEPPSPRRPVVPKLPHPLRLALPGERDEDARTGSGSARRQAPHRPSARAATAVPAQVFSARMFDASVALVDSPALPPVRPTASSRGSAGGVGTATAEFQVLHPSLDAADESGELSRLLLGRWSALTDEPQFASAALFCEVKLGEAQRMAARVAAPSRFVAVACCQLLDRFVARLEAGADRADAAGVRGAAFLRKALAELTACVFLPGSGDLQDRLPYFVELRRLQRTAEALTAAAARRDKELSARERLPDKVDKLAARWRARLHASLRAHVFRGWRRAIAAQREIRALKCRVFHSLRKTSLSALFRAWRVEALRRAYQRESSEYQTMLSITAAALSRKDIAISDAEAKITSMGRIIDSLTESNRQLSARVEQLERLVASGDRDGGGGGGGDGDRDRDGHGSVPPAAGVAHRLDVQFDRIDTLAAQDDARADGVNRMLLETMFGMARMVEAAAIQMAKDAMDSLEFQLDGSVLQHLAESIQAENALQIKAESGAADARRPRRVTIRDLALMPVDALLLYWFRMNLQLSAAVEKASDRTVKNFTSDLADGRRLSFLLHHLFPTFFDASMAHEIDADQRLRNIATFHARVQPELPAVVTADSIHAGSATENVAFVAMLFSTSIGSVRRVNLEKQRGDFLNIVSSWRRVRSLLLEIKRMNDNYDAHMVAHLLKEMRTCETLFKQLHGELSAIAVASNEAASALSQVAFKILTITWSCVRTRGLTARSDAPPTELIDERWLERLRDFGALDAAVVRELLVRQSELDFRSAKLKAAGPRSRASTSTSASANANAAASLALMAPVVPERDVLTQTEALRRVLHVYAKDLHDTFKHYSASGGLGSVATLSLSEYSKFIKDCFSTDKSITGATAEEIYHLSLRVVDPVGAAGPGAAGEEAREMAGSEFVEALVRLAAAKFSSTGVPLADKLRELMEQDVLPRALRSQSEVFRAEVAAPKVREVFQRHKPELQRVFRYYASMHSLREQQSTLALKELVVLAKDCKLVGSFVSEHTLRQVLANLQREAEPGREDDLRADFADFQEAIAALTEYVICSPYVPLHKRVDQFISEMLLPRARQKKTKVAAAD